MHYLLTPLHTHLDFGFGATAEAFKQAGDRLESQMSARGSIFNEHLPINYLRRHSIELFLKSAIVIIHRRLALPYGAEPPGSMPHALVAGKWVPFHKLHSVKKLWDYLATLFQDHKAFFDSVERVNWSFPPEMDHWIDDIELHDPKSTFSRYPDTGDSSRDVPKAVMSEATPDAIAERVHADEAETKQTILLIGNSESALTKGFYYAGDSLAGFAETLKQCANLFYGTHAALRSEVCGGA